MGDKDIDLSEIPEVTAEQMSRAKMRAAGGKPVTRGKVRINMYLDAEIVEYFKTQVGGRGYQTLINQTLRESIRHKNPISCSDHDHNSNYSPWITTTMTGTTPKQRRTTC